MQDPFTDRVISDLGIFNPQNRYRVSSASITRLLNRFCKQCSTDEMDTILKQCMSTNHCLMISFLSIVHLKSSGPVWSSCHWVVAMKMLNVLVIWLICANCCLFCLTQLLIQNASLALLAKWIHHSGAVYFHQLFAILCQLKGNCHEKIFSWFSYIWVVLDVITSYSKSYNLNCSFLEVMAHGSCTVQIHPVLRVWLADIHVGVV